MKHVIVTDKITGGIGAGLDGTHASRLPSDLDNLTAGGLTLGRSDTNLYAKFTSATAIFNSTLKTGETVHFVQKMSNGDLYKSPEINVDTLKWHKTTHTSYNQKVVDLGYSATNSGKTWTLPTPSDHIGEYVAIRIYDTSKQVDEGLQRREKSVHYQIKSGDTAATIHTALYNKLKDYEGTFFATVAKNVSGTDYGYTFTGVAGKNFRIVPEELLLSSPITINTEIANAIGEGDMVLAMEKDGAARRGYNASEMAHSELYTSPFMASTTTNYDIFVLTWTNKRGAEMDEGATMKQELIIATPVNGASATAQKISDQVEDVLQAIADQDKVWDTVA